MPYPNALLQATPRNALLGNVADFIAQSYSPERTQQAQGIANFLSLPQISRTLDRLSYGEPLTTGAGGIGGTTRFNNDALDAAMAIAPAVGPAAKLAGKGAMATGEFIAPKLGQMAEGYMASSGMMPHMAERVGNLKAVEALFPGQTEAALSPAGKSALTKYKSMLDNPTVMRREVARLHGTGDIVEPSLNVAQEMGIEPGVLLDKYVVPMMWDTSATGGNVTQIAGVPLTEGLKNKTPAFVQRQGGRLFPYIQENLEQGIGGASNVSAQSSKINNLNKYSELGDTLAVQMNLAPSGINFSHHVADAYVGMLDYLKPSKDALSSFKTAVQNTKVQNPVTKEISYPYKNFPGLESANIREILQNGVPGEYSAGNIRKAIAETGSTMAMEKQGFPRWQDIYKVMSEPGAETGMAHTIMSVKPKTQMVIPNFQHGSYNAGLEANLLGSLQNAEGKITGIPDYLMMPKTFANRLAQGKTLSNIRTSLLKSHHGEKLDQQAIDNIAKYLGYQVD